MLICSRKIPLPKRAGFPENQNVFGGLIWNILRKYRTKVILIGVQANLGDDMEESLDELGELAATAGAYVAGRIIQNREAIHPGTYIGKGKIEEVKGLLYALNANGVICDDELSPAQMNNLERELECKVMGKCLADS